MKKILLSIVSLATIGISAASAQYVSFGPIVGGGFSGANHDNRETVKIGSYEVGLSMIYAKKEHWGFGVDLLYSKEGFRENYRMPSAINFDVQHNLHYVRIPIKAIYFFGQYNDKFRPKIFGGPTLGFGVAEVNKFIANNEATETYLNRADINYINECNTSIDLGLQIGAGINFNMGKGRWLNTDVSYYHGLLNQAGNDNEKFTNYNLRLNVGLLFPIMSNNKK